MGKMDKNSQKSAPRYTEKKDKSSKGADVAYVAAIAVIFAAVSGAMVFMPRSRESVLEQRELAEFPAYSHESLMDGTYTAEISHYFSDTVPMRDRLMEMASAVQEFTGFRSNDIKLHNVTLAENTEETSATEETAPVTEITVISNGSVVEDTDNVSNAETEVPAGTEAPAPAVTQETTAAPADDAVSLTNNGIAVVGTRAIMLYGGSYSVGEDYAAVVEKYKKALGDDVNVYCMVIPTSSEFYCPESISSYNNSQLDNINNIYSHLTNAVPVDAYSALKDHTAENIYFRTDHHWSSLGAYYAAEKFAETAGVPFLDLSEYDMHTVEGYVGTMYSYTQDITIKNNPEDFFYYVPKNVELDTTYYNYKLGDGNEIIGMDEPMKSTFYLNFSNSKSMLYCTFMGGDAKITHVNTSTKNGRRLAIFKDSYGNALPQFLFGSFEDIYVIDMRYFTYNAEDYLKEHGITDVLFANNAFHATTRSTVNYYEKLLTQGRQPAETSAAGTTSAPAVTSAPAAGSDAKNSATSVTEIPEQVTETDIRKNEE